MPSRKPKPRMHKSAAPAYPVRAPDGDDLRIAWREQLSCECEDLLAQLERRGVLELLGTGAIAPRTPLEHSWATSAAELQARFAAGRGTRSSSDPSDAAAHDVETDLTELLAALERLRHEVVGQEAVRASSGESRRDSSGERSDALAPLSEPPSPGVQGQQLGPTLTTDDMFEAFLRSQTQSKTVILLARASFYGETIFEQLYPEDAAAPPDLTYPDLDAVRALRFARPSYRDEDVEVASRLWQDFADAHWDRFQRYQQILLNLEDASGE